MALLTSSEKFRKDLLNRNLKTLPDQLQRKDVAQNNPILSTYEDDLGEEATIRSRGNVKNPGSIFTYAPKQRQKNLKNNADYDEPTDIIADVEEFPETTKFAQKYNNSLGKEARISSANKISNKEDVNSEGDVSRQLNLQKNKEISTSNFDQDIENKLVRGGIENYGTIYETRGSEFSVNDYHVKTQKTLNSLDHINNYGHLNLNHLIPNSFSVFSVTVNAVRDFLGNNKYVDTTSANYSYGYEPNEYVPSDFLNLRSTQSPLGVLGQEPPLENETRMMNLAAKSLQFNFNARVRQELEEETYGRIGLFDAATNPIKAIDLLKNPDEELIQKNYNITVPSNPLAKFGTFLASLAGIEIPTSIIPYPDKILVPNCYKLLNNNDESPTVIGEPIRGEKRSKMLLRYTSAGQKSSLFSNMKLNLYAPDYDIQRRSSLGQALDKLKDKVNNVVGFLGGNPPEPRKYIGHIDNDYNSIMQDEDGTAILRSNNYLTEAFTGPSEIEPETSKHGRLNTSLTWSSEQFDDINKYRANTNTRFSSDLKNRFVDCSLMDKTQRLLNEGGINRFISQLKHTFDDGFERYSKGSGVKKVDQATTSDGSRIYGVADKDTVDNEFCRTWTKTEPHHKVKHAMKYKELIRKERSSVISRNTNYNIFPSQINVNHNWTVDNSDEGELGGKRATKYLLSIENLAWKDYPDFDDLPECEKGVNGGRVMWFPPYNLSFTDRTTASWNEHNFVGRPEPMFSYNHAKRSGTLQFDIVVDHPSILNMLVQSELQNLEDDKVDEILNAFWAGCIEFDIFELARVWGVFTTSEIEYFNQLLNNLNKKQSKEENQKKLNVDQDTPVKNEISSSNINPSNIKGGLENKFIVFENDKPLPDNKRDGKILPIDDYVEEFYPRIANVNQSVDGLPAKKWKSEQFDKIKKNLQKLTSLTPGQNVTITVNSYASPIYVGSGSAEAYNNELAKRRLISFSKFVAELVDGKKDEQGQDLNPDDIDINFINNNNEIEFYKPNKTGDANDKIIIKIGNVTQVSSQEIVNKFGGENDVYETRLTSGDTNEITCTIDDYTDPNNYACAINSIPAIYSRRVEISDVSFEENKPDDANDGDGINRQKNSTLVEDSNLTLTKRDIAQRILNKFITECDYFEYLKENSPKVFQSLKQKLKYFMPSFHSMTPEGLNGRMTFLNQCLRPGDTITEGGDSSCDATNTAFGRPPICVLRIGDFFNGKIVPNNLDFSYDKTTWDFNPEGIGMQPMIVTVDMQFDVIGGHSLTKPVSELQNALSFDFYGNTEIYDERSYRNQTSEERKLINQEQGFFNDKLDIDIITDTVEDIDVSERAKNENFEPFIGKLSNSYTPEKSTKKAFIEEYGKNYVFKIDLDYKDVFSDFYKNINDYLSDYTQLQKDLNDDLNPILNNSIIFNSNNDIYYTSGINDHPIGGGKKQNIKLNLYPVEGLYKLANGSKLTFPTKPIFQTTTLDSLKLPNSLNVGNIEEELNNYRDNLMKRIDYGLITPIMNDSSVRKAYQQLSGVKRNKINKVIKNKLDNRVNNILQSLESRISENNNLFESAILGIDYILPPVTGIDGEILNSGGGNKYEVIPNGKELSIDINNFFDHEPFYEIKVPVQSDVTSIADGSNINQYTSEKYGAIVYLNDYIGSGGFMDNNNMPYFDFNNKKWDANGGIVTGDTAVSKISSNYKMKYNFEKINYEVLDTVQKLYGFYKNDETPIGDYKNQQFEVVEENVKFNQKLDKEQLQLFVGDSDATLKNRKLKNKSGFYNDITDKLNKLFSFTYGVSDVTFNKARNDYEVSTNDDEDLLEKDITMDTDNLQNNSRTLDKSVKNLTGEYIAFEEMIFHEFYTEDENFVDDIESELNNINSNRNSKNKEKSLQDRFLSGLSQNIQKIKEGFTIPQESEGSGVDKLENKIKDLNNDKINSVDKKRENLKLEPSDGDYTLKMRKSNYIFNYGNQKLKNYRTVEELFNSKK